MRIGVDFGGVIIDVTSIKIRLAGELFGVRLNPTTAVEPTLDPKFSPDDYRRLQNLVYGTSELLDAQAVTGAVSSIKQLIRQGHQITIVSNIQAPGVQFARQWLTDNELDSDMLISVGVGGDKKMVVRHKFDVFIDARYEILAPLVDFVPHLYLFNTIHNQHATPKAPITRVADWAELRVRLTHLTKASHADWL